MTRLDSLAQALDSGTTTSRALTEACLDKAEQGEGPRVFIQLDRDGALAAADAMDALRKVGQHPSAYAGIPISVKDLFDVQGQVTRAGSRVLTGAPAETDAPAIAHLRQAGFVLVGRSNMTEFAYSGLGMNPHHGTPANPWDRENARIPGGSSSGAAISVSDGMAHAGIGSDTGGSCRIPAALCGLTGYKPTQSRVSLKGTAPLSFTLDSIGSLGRSPRCVEILDAVMAGERPKPAKTRPVSGMRLLAPPNLVLDGMDKKVAADFVTAVAKLRKHGATVDERVVQPLDRLPKINAKGGFAAAEAVHWHKALMAKDPDGYDPRVITRIRKGESQTAADYITLLQDRERFIADMAHELTGYDALILPTVPTVAPKIADLDADEQLYGDTNLLMLRNPSVINFLDGCAISLPMHEPGSAPTGIMIAQTSKQDQQIFGIAHGLFPLVKPN
jgi:aspartyl-tRNA(Asn)/glutamyl-tRNA(Gln) amidotransferase subunit A